MKGSHLPPGSIFVGSVTHARTRPVAHSFTYPLTFLLCDARQLDCLSKRYRFFSVNRFNLLSIDDREFLGGEKLGTLEERFNACFPDPPTEARSARLFVLSLPRLLFRNFKPVTVFFEMDENGRMVRAIAEVHNTFHEVHVYPLRGGSENGSFRSPKQFYVSPFFGIDGDYEFRFVFEPRACSVEITYFRNGEPALHTRFVGDGAAFSDAALFSTAFQAQFQAACVRGRITLQALRLRWLSKLRMCMRPKATHPNTIVKRHRRA